MEPKRIILHHSLTRDSQTVSWDAIRRYHVFNNGWAAIGYHWGIELIGSTYETMIGRVSDRQGAHAYGQNGDSIGICFVGNYDLKSPTSEMLDQGLLLVRWLMRIYDIKKTDVYPQ